MKALRTSTLTCLACALIGCGGPAGAPDASTSPDSGTNDVDAAIEACGTGRPELGTIQGMRGIVIARDGTIYFTHYTGVGRVLPGGTVDTSWLAIGSWPYGGLALDATNETLFVALPQVEGVELPSIYRVEVATGTAAPIHDGGGVAALTIGPDGLLYFSDFQAGHVFRLDPAGGTAMQVTTSTLDPSGLAFEAAGTLLVADVYGGMVRRITLSSGTETAREPVAPMPTPLGIALDASGRIYVTSEFGGFLQRMNADGSDSVTLVPALDSPFFIEFGHGALGCSDLYVAVPSAPVVRFENDTAGADVPWH